MVSGATSDPDFESIFISAVFKGNTEMVKALIAGNDKINSNTIDTAYTMVNRRNTELFNIIKHLQSECEKSKNAN